MFLRLRPLQLLASLPDEVIAGLGAEQGNFVRRGRDFGVTYAEGFRHYRHEPYPRDAALEALLGEAVLALPAWPAA